MQVRKLGADEIFDGYELKKNHVLVLDSLGMVVDLLPHDTAGEGIESFRGLLTPGFINCHYHLELSHMKGKIAVKTGLVDFVLGVVMNRNASLDEIETAIERADQEMYEGGIVAVGDICNTRHSLLRKSRSPIHYYNFLEATGWLPSLSQARFEAVKGLFAEYEALYNDAAWAPVSIVPHAPYSVSNELWSLIQPYFTNRIVSIHNQETGSEDEFFLSGTGKFLGMYEMMKIDNSHHLPTGQTSLRSYYEKLQPATRAILVHNTYTTESDLIYVQETSGNSSHRNHYGVRNHPDPYFCLCVNANLYIEDKLPAVERMVKHSCRIVLGTDSLASNHSLSIADEIKTIRTHFPGIALEQVLGWATLNGAKALGIDERFGSFEKGKQPRVVLVDTDTGSSKRIA